MNHSIHVPRDPSDHGFVAHTMMMNKNVLQNLISKFGAHNSGWELRFSLSEYTLYSSHFMELFPNDYIEENPFMIRDHEIPNRVMGDYCPTFDSMYKVKYGRWRW